MVAGCIPALQPILLGGLLAAHRLSAAQIGQAATLEALGMAVSVTLVTALVRPTHLRPIAAVAALTLALANLATTAAPPLGILAARTLNGAGSGVLLWVLVGMLTRAEAPGRLFAIYVTAQAAGAFALSSLFSAVIAPHFGVIASYLVLAALGAALIPLARLVPGRYPLLAQAGGASLPNLAGGAGLLATGCHMAGVTALWVYLVPLGRQLGIGQSTIDLAVSAAIGVQILGGLAAIASMPRLRAGWLIPLAALASAAAVALIALRGGDTAVFYAGAAIFAFFWMFTPPFQLPFLMQLDASHRSASFVSTAQLFGMSAGPLIASLTIGHGNFMGAAVASGALFVAAGLLACAGSAVARS